MPSRALCPCGRKASRPMATPLSLKVLAILWVFVFSGTVSTGSRAYELGPELQLAGEIVQPTYVLQTVEHTPDVAMSGEYGIAVWVLSRRYIAWSFSTDGGSTWAYGGRLPWFEETHDFTFPTVCADESGVFHVAALNSNFRSLQTIATYRLTFQNDGFVADGPFLTVPRLQDTQGLYQFPRLSCDPSSGRLYLSYTFLPMVSNYPTGSFIYFTTLIDSQWATPLVLSDGACNGSSVVVGPDHEVYVFWNDFRSKKIVGRRSPDLGSTFEPEFVVGPTNENFTLPPGATQSVRLNVLYPCNETDLALNYPSVGVDRSIGPNRGRLYAVWTEQASGNTSTVTEMLSEVEPNGTQTTAMRLPLDSQITGTARYVHFEGGERDVFYFDGAEGQIISFEGHLSVVCGGYSIQEPWASSFLHRSLQRVFDPATPPVVFTIPSNRRYYLSLASGGFSVGYNIRLKRLIPDFAGAARDHRDVIMTSSSDGGLTWTPKVLVNDDPPRFDNYLPRLAVDGSGGIHVAWYDRRDDPVSGSDYNVYWRYSGDGGSTFLPSARLSGTTSVVPRSSSRMYMGDYLALGATPSGAIALWTQMQTNAAYPSGTDQDINLRQVTVERPIAVQLDKLRATASSRWVRLNWRVISPAQAWRFRVFRQIAEAENYELIGTVDGSAGDRGRFEFLDHEVTGGQAISYKLQIVQNDGALFWSEPVDVSVPGNASTLSLHVEPNPFGTVELKIDTGSSVGALQVRIFDIRGAEVCTLHNGIVESGFMRFQWDGRNNSGRYVSPGVYFVEATKGTERARAKLVQLNPQK
jgi:hypothetical protein